MVFEYEDHDRSGSNDASLHAIATIDQCRRATRKKAQTPATAMGKRRMMDYDGKTRARCICRTRLQAVRHLTFFGRRLPNTASPHHEFDDVDPARIAVLYLPALAMEKDICVVIRRTSPEVNFFLVSRTISGLAPVHGCQSRGLVMLFGGVKASLRVRIVGKFRELTHGAENYCAGGLVERDSRYQDGA